MQLAKISYMACMLFSTHMCSMVLPMLSLVHKWKYRCLLSRHWHSSSCITDACPVHAAKWNGVRPKLTMPPPYTGQKKRLDTWRQG